MSWFEEWFDSPLYEKLYVNRNEEEARLLAGLIEREIPKKKYPEILDLGCGRGRHSITLAGRGYQVTGVDLSAEAIKKARKKAALKNLENVTFRKGDMRKPLPRSFNAIVNLFTTFGYFFEDSENIRVLKSAGTMLQPGGLFLIDFLNSRYVQNHLISRDSGNYSGLSYRIKRFVEGGMVYKKIHFSGKDLPESVEYQERVKLYDLEWFAKRLAEQGFSLEKTYGDYLGSPFKSSESSRLLLIARKD